MEKIFFDDQDEITGRFFVIDEDENSIWAYLTFPFEEKIDKDCFLGSRLKITKETFDLARYKKKRIPPPMIEEYSTKDSYMPNLEETDFSIDWGKNGNVVLKINEIPFLFFADDENRGFSKSIAKNGMYGNSWNEDKFREKMK